MFAPVISMTVFEAIENIRLFDIYFENANRTCSSISEEFSWLYKYYGVRELCGFNFGTLRLSPSFLEGRKRPILRSVIVGAFKEFEASSRDLYFVNNRLACGQMVAKFIIRQYRSLLVVVSRTYPLP